jgi:hypothetical protein
LASRPSAGHAPAKVNSRPCASSWVNASTIAGPHQRVPLGTPQRRSRLGR